MRSWPIWTQKFRRFIDHALIGAIEQGGHDLMYEVNLIFAFSERYLAENEEILERQKEAWRGIDVARYTAMLRSIRDWSIDDRLAEIEAPALVLWGNPLTHPLAGSRQIGQTAPSTTDWQR